MKNFESFKLLINEERRTSVFRPLNDVYIALQIDKTKLVTFNSPYIYICIYTYIRTYIHVIVNID